MVIEMPLNEKDEKAIIECKYLTWSKCPYCGSGVDYYRTNKYNSWEEDIYFLCGLHIKSKTPTVMEVWSMCKNSLEYDQLKKKRLEEYNKLEKFINENIKEERLLRELNDKMNSIKSNIVNWWGL